MASTSVQDMVRPAECVDLYYYDGQTSTKQCFPTTQNTKYVQAFQSNGAGQSVFTIPPQNGIQDVVLTFGITVPAVANCSLIAGWGYALIDQVSFRYGGSSQFFLTGQQILQNALRKQPSRATADDVFNLGGLPITSSAGGAQTVYASVVLTLPHNSVPTGVGKPHPLPTDILTQQTQITCVLKSPASVFWGASVASAPTLLTLAQFQVQQVMLNNQGDALARRVNMADNAYAFPCEFVQQESVIAAGGASYGPAAPWNVTLTGFRSGEVKSIHVWLTRVADVSTPTTSNDPFDWQAPLSIEMLYAGDKYAVYNNNAGQLFNLLNGNKVPGFDNTLSSTGAGYLATWTELPFGQTHVEEDAHSMLVHGKPITNGIVNLTVTPPSSQVDWILHVSYNYNATLLFSQGTCDYVF
jgi:hypothetical protein